MAPFSPDTVPPSNLTAIPNAGATSFSIYQFVSTIFRANPITFQVLPLLLKIRVLKSPIRGIKSYFTV